MKIQLTEKEMEAFIKLQTRIEGLDPTNLKATNTTINIDEEVIVKLIECVGDIAIPLSIIMENTDCELRHNTDTDLIEIIENFRRVVIEKQDCLIDATLTKIFGKSLFSKTTAKEIISNSITKIKIMASIISDKFLNKLDEIFFSDYKADITQEEIQM